MLAAITAARQGAEVTILEAGERIGKKLLSTGNGKCNLGNLFLSAECYYGGDKDFIAQALAHFDTMDTIRFFQGIGLLIKDKNGYLYPACEQAAVILDTLRFEIKSLGIKVCENCKVTKLHKTDKKLIVTASENKYEFDSVILACGGKAAPKTGSDGSGFALAGTLGHHIVNVVPALVQLICREDYLKAVAGVRTDAEITLISEGRCIAKERGELQLTDYGVSGIPVFQISRVVNYLLLDKKTVQLQINLLPDLDEGEFHNLCLVRELLQQNRNIEEFFTGMLHKKLMFLFIKLAGLKVEMPVEKAGKEKLKAVYDLCRSWRLTVSGSKTFEQAQVCAGGVDLTEITENMESKKIQGVYFAGEMMDVDGKCGGYNLQWAWTSGYLAGMGAAGTPVIKETNI